MVNTFYTAELEQRLAVEAAKKGITPSEALRIALNTPSYLGACGYAYEQTRQTTPEERVAEARIQKKLHWL